MDVCMSDIKRNGEFQYHFWGSCLVKDQGYWSNSEAPPLCRNSPGCLTGAAAFTKSAFIQGQPEAYSTFMWDTPIGLARDGHVIIGPYNEYGRQNSCTDRDTCNGRFIGSQYVYVGTPQFPYTIGCWGPGPDSLYAPGCTTNPCGGL